MALEYFDKCFCNNSSKFSRLFYKLFVIHCHTFSNPLGTPGHSGCSPFFAAISTIFSFHTSLFRTVEAQVGAHFTIFVRRLFIVDSSGELIGPKANEANYNK